MRVGENPSFKALLQMPSMFSKNQIRLQVVWNIRSENEGAVKSLQFWSCLTCLDGSSITRLNQYSGWWPLRLLNIEDNYSISIMLWYRQCWDLDIWKHCSISSLEIYFGPGDQLCVDYKHPTIEQLSIFIDMELDKRTILVHNIIWKI